MANPEHLGILKQGVEVWNEWRRANQGVRSGSRRPDLSGADFQSVDLRPANMDFVNLDNANLSGTNLSRVRLTGTNLSGTNLNGANLEGAGLIGANLSSANLSGTNLTGANLTEADLTEADLSEAKLTKANLMLANFSSAKLIEADLSEAKLTETKLVETDLTEAILRSAIFSDAYLQGTNFTKAFSSWTKFADIDLSKVKGLETIVHGAPSTIGIDTIYKSGGNIPEVFLRGCGVPDTFITFAKSLVGKAIDYYSAFISYSSRNHDFAERLYADLQSKGVRCWFAPEDIKIGDKFRQRIDEAIRIHDKLLVILSEESIDSAWVEEEVESAIEREQREKRLVLFPLRIDDAVINCDQAWAASLRRMRHIGDFSRWKDHDSYSKAFARLLRDLKAESKS